MGAVVLQALRRKPIRQGHSRRVLLCKVCVLASMALLAEVVSTIAKQLCSLQGLVYQTFTISPTLTCCHQL